MKLSRWLNVIKESRLWLTALCACNAFFIFLAWVAYPETFNLLVGFMMVFTLISILLTILLVVKKNEKHDKIFYDFIRDPSTELECALISSYGSLHKEKVSCLANKLRELNDQLDEIELQSMNDKEFIESWVHEIKAPIALINLVLENRKEEMSQLVYQKIEHARINIYDHVEQILFYARLQASHVDYRLERISFSLCCEEVMLDLKGMLEEKSVKVISEMEDVPVVSDKKALYFILTQVFLNSLKYSKEKIQSFIMIKTGFNKGNNQYFISITDNGTGVLDSELPFIFDKGFTGENTDKKQSSGIGLYLVKKLCDELQIEINVESEYGKGFEITFYFPEIYIS
ncbi:HAMP domain-containing sensor histidine kinase [Jeotgalibacillus sp. R-1-5s-1]|uniref:sensor histidine kinase n=1 Tax=Jeotgalibacillus sp. R-1-5s-1 TaxID=2555897 RepID=UPI00106D66B1|nr:sensor histidine kinase [Jeotgalibacillus sp. R-1-5s-1]TFD92262.1 HAMP domain-containing histidine kinase [Jeotgalibacillus sp. R-1-5s-1]